MWMWALAVVLIVILGLVFAVALRPTTVTVTPRTQGIVFDPSLLYNAYPAQTAAIGTLPYTV